MSRRWRRGGWIAAVLLGAAWAGPGPAGASEALLFGPVQYTRTSGLPTQFQETLPLPPHLGPPFRLHVQNGSAGGSGRLSSATLTLNGTVVAGPADFSPQVAAFDRAVDLQPTNTLQVRLTSAPGSFLVLTLFGTLPPVTLTRLEPPSLPITQGGTGTLTATLSQPPPTPTSLSLTSSAPAIASVPATVPVPAGALAVPIPVAAIAPGTALITASLHGSSLQSTISVVPAGPTLSSLLPPTLQVSQGAAGSLTLTLSAAQASDTLVALTVSAPALVGLPPEGSLTVPAGQRSQAFAVFGKSVGTATLTAALNGSTAQSEISVVQPLPTLVSLVPPVLPLSEGSSGLLTLTLNASQPTDTLVWLATDRPDLLGLPGDQGTVPAGHLTLAVPVRGLGRGLATIRAALGGSSAAAAVEIQPPPPTLAALGCPPTPSLGATTHCTVTLTATPPTATAVPLAVGDPGVLTGPEAVVVPAHTLTAAFSVTGLGLGSSPLTAGPLHGTSQTTTIAVLPPPPRLGSLTPSTPTVALGAPVRLTLSLAAAQGEDTRVPLTWAPAGLLAGPPELVVPAGSLQTGFSLTALSPGPATVTAGPLNESTAQSTVTVLQQPPALTGIDPAVLSLPKGQAGTLSVTIAPTQGEPTGVPLTSSAPGIVEVPGSVTVPAGEAAAAFPVIARAEGPATISAGPLHGTTQQALVSVTPAALRTLSVAPPGPGHPARDDRGLHRHGELHRREHRGPHRHRHLDEQRRGHRHHQRRGACHRPRRGPGDHHRHRGDPHGDSHPHRDGPRPGQPLRGPGDRHRPRGAAGPLHRHRHPHRWEHPGPHRHRHLDE